MNAEISFDTMVPDTGSEHVEGCYRLGSSDWRVFYATQAYQGSPRIFPATWQSGASGIQIHHPKNEILNKASVKSALAEMLNVSEWIEVRGPDSLQMK
jgi:hypothetical protein